LKSKPISSRISSPPIGRAVVEVVEDGGRQDPVEPEDAGLFVELVLVAAAARDLDDDLDDLRKRGVVLASHARTIRHARPTSAPGGA
jgi:hypothetical protein